MHISCFVFAALCGAYFYLLTYCVSVNGFCGSNISFLDATEEGVHFLSPEKFASQLWR